MSDRGPSLDALRREIDEIDDTLHDLLMRRAAAVERIRAAKRGGRGGFLRPGREAAILRRLAARHHGDFPVASVVAIWREIFAALTGLQGPFSVAVFAPEEGSPWTALARAHFGSVTPLQAMGRPSQVVAAVTEGSAAVGVLPLPQEQDANPWWRYLVSDRRDRPRIVARLPFLEKPANGREVPEALVVGRMAPEETGDDRSFLVLQAGEHISRSRINSALDEAELVSHFYGAWRDDEHPKAWHHLIELTGHHDGRSGPVRRLVKGFEPNIDKVYALGGYAVPLKPDSGEDE